MAERKLVVKIIGDASSFDKALKQGARSIVSFRNIAKATLGFQAITAGLNALGDSVRAGVSEFSEQQKVAAQTQAVLKSTGNAAGVTAGQVDKLSEAISRYSGIDDEAVTAGQNLLLTFPQIRNEVGKGNDIFTRATRTVADLSVAMGLDMRRAALQVGKALNDPERGFSRLQRIGVAFSKSQVAAIKGFVKTGQVAKAQQVILAELNKEFGGSARALGNTIPGKLNRLKETLRNVGGELVGKLAPSFSAALDSALKFVDGLQRAQGTGAKIRFVLTGAEQLARDLFNQVRSALGKVDFSEALDTVQTQLFSGLTRLGSFLNQVDFAKLGRDLGALITRGLSGAAAYLEALNWEFVGKRIVDGIGNFLKGVDWKALISAVFRLIVASMQATKALLEGAGKAIGKGIARALGDALGAGANYVKKKALQVALEIVEALDFTIFGKTVIPGIEGLKKSITSRLDAIADNAEKNAKRIADAAAAISAATKSSRPEATGARSEPDKPAKRRPTGAGAAATAAAESAAADTKATKTAAERAAEAARKAREAFDKLLDGLNLGLEKAQTTARFNDDLVELRKIQKALQDRLRIEKDSVDLQRQLFQTEQQIGDIQQQQRDARQFRSLGLSATGGQLDATRAGLRAQLRKVSSSIVGTDANTGANRKALAAIRRLILDPTKKVSVEVRNTIRQMLDDISRQIGDKAKTGPLTKTTSLNAKSILEGMTGLSASEKKELRSRLSRFNSAGVALSGPGGFRTFQPTNPGWGGIAVTVNAPDVYLDGVKVSTVTRRHDQVHARRNPKQKRGPNA